MTAKNPTADSIFSVAVDIESQTKRNQYVENACGDDVEMKDVVMRLVEAHFKSGSFMDWANENSQPTSAKMMGDDFTSQQVGLYKLREKLGEGGMGIVYAAEQEHPVRRKVALKIIKPGMDSREVISRFEAERQALAMMDHQNIARVLDAGATDTGLPYFVMELVRGVSVTQYCDKNKLSIRERLELFVQICKAVQHAHQKGIIHRDLKPSNVMITLHDGVPVSKVIDFGVAKAINQRLTEGTVYTKVAQVLGTPAYMSPEQAELSGLDIDTRSDIYSLGVLLYELLTGAPPFDKETFKQADFDEVRRIIREDEPPRPSDRVSTLNAELQSTVSDQRMVDRRALCQSLRGDLDWIVMKALEKDRIRRYETANALADDIQRFLDDEPVLACPPSTVYRLRKFARRNKIGLAFATAFGLFLIVGIVGLGISNHMLAEREKETLDALDQADEYLKLAKKRENEATLKSNLSQNLQDFLIEDLIGQTDQWDSNYDPKITLIDSVQIAASNIKQRFSNEPIAKAAAYMSILPAFSADDKHTAAADYARRAFDLRLKSLGPDHPDTLYSQASLAGLLAKCGQLKEAHSLSHAALRTCEQQLPRDHDARIKALQSVTLVYMYSFNLIEAEKFNQQVVDFYLAKVGPSDHRTLNAIVKQSDLKRRLEKFDEALSLGEQAVDQATESLKSDSLVALRAHRNLAKIHGDTGELDKAIAECQKILRVSESAFNPTHLFYLETRRYLAVCLAKAEQFEEAETVLQELLQQLDEKKDSLNYLDTLLALADFYKEIENWEALEASDRKIIAIATDRFGHLNERVGTATYNLAQTLLSQKKYAELVEFMESHIPSISSAVNSDDTNLKATNLPPAVVLAFSHCFMGVAQFALRKNEDSLSNLDTSIDLCKSLETNPVAHWIKCTAYNTKAAVLAELGKFEQSAKAWESYRELYEKRASAISAENLLQSSVTFARLCLAARDKGLEGYEKRAVLCLKHYLAEDPDVDFERLDRILADEFKSFSDQSDFKSILSEVNRLKSESDN